MKHLSLIVFLLIHCVILSQEWENLELLPKKYQIDGSISAIESMDTSAMETVVSDKRFTIKKSKDFTYIGIKSNTSTILNTYIISPEKILVFHASAALGQMDFLKKGAAYEATKSKFDWIYRDPIAWGDEMHPDGAKTIEDFYKRYGWTSNTWFSGSHREMEMIIDNAHFDVNSRLLISFTSSENDVREIRFKEKGKDASITGDFETDKKLHQGSVPKKISLSEK